MTEYEKERYIARAERLEAICKVLRCVASQEDSKRCYADIYDDNHKDDPNHPGMICGEAIGFICCPYYQSDFCGKNSYSIAMKEAAEIIEKTIGFS